MHFAFTAAVLSQSPLNAVRSDLMGMSAKRGKTAQPELREFSTSPARGRSRCTNPEAASMPARKSLSSGWPVFPIGFSCLRFLSRLAEVGLGIVPFRRTLFHLSPYTFKQPEVRQVHQIRGAGLPRRPLRRSLPWQPPRRATPPGRRDLPGPRLSPSLPFSRTARVPTPVFHRLPAAAFRLSAA